VAVTAAGGALWRLVRVAGILRSMAQLRRVADAPRPVVTPLVSVLVPARDEERCLEACLDSLSRQRYPHLGLVVVDDGSTDRIPSIIARAVARDPRVRSIRLEGPPEGWTGKNFALATAAAVARGEWLCFTDADTVHAPTSVERAVSFAQDRGLALLS